MTVEVTTLANGLRVATDRMEGVESATVGVWVGAGTRYETAEVNGVAHLLEHMAFKGTKTRSARAIVEAIEAVGGALNAYTSREQTAYHARVLGADLPLAVDLLADILQHSVFDATELERERAVVAQEIGQAEDTPDDVIFDRYQGACYPDQPMGWPVLGTHATLAGLSRPAILGYLDANYGASRMVLAAAGDVEHDKLRDLAGRAFEGLAPQTADAPAPARYAGGDSREARDLEQLHLVLGFQGLSYLDPDFYALSVYSMLLGGGMSSRLFQEVREKRGLVYTIHSFTSFYSDGGLFGIYAGTGPKEAGELVPVIAETVQATARDTTEDEINRAKAQLKAGILMSRESSGARCEQLANQLLVFGRPLPPEEIASRIDAVDGAAIARVAGRLCKGKPTLAALGPTGGLETFERLQSRFG
ncbi:MAG: insulinase family protein [Alphaproteobacteria bacterium]|nr:insulinase family protein [Alphaproteobacteria bacterium]